MKLSLPSSLLLLLLIFPSLIPLYKHIQAGDGKYDICKEDFKCGKLTIGYPFYVDDRPEYCGYPGFELDCSGLMPVISMSRSSTQMFSVLDYSNTSHTISVVRTDYWQNYCPKDLESTSINYTLFNYTPTDVNVTLYYQCSYEEAADPMYQFFCPGSTNEYGYFRSQIWAGLPAIPPSQCLNNVSVPVNRTAAASVRTISDLQGVFQSGFELEWSANNQLCDGCVNSGGVCGYDLTQKKSTCYCADGDSHDFKCTVLTAGKPKSKKTAAIVGAIGSIGLLAFLACLALFIIRRRRRTVLFQSHQIKDVVLSPPSSGLSSSNGFRYSRDSTTSPSTNQSQSIPSYPSSKSEFDNASFYYGVKVFSYAELEEATENFNESRVLGDGGFGTVYYGKLHDGRDVAVKRLYESSCKHMGQFQNEVEILARLRHKYLVTLHGCTSRRSKELLLVYEYISNGTVADHLHGKKFTESSNALPWSTRLSIAVQTAEALTFLHKSDVVHRDVKTTNILLEKDFQVKVADFGLSRLFPTDVTHVSTAPQGTPGYVDPEYYKCYQLTEKSDVYSFGVVLAELISSKPAVDISRHRHDINLSSMTIDRVRKNALNELVDPALGYDSDHTVQKMVKLMGELAFQCLQEEREMRPCMEEVLKSLRGIQNETTNSMKQVVVDIQESDDVGLLNNAPPPLSPETEVFDKRG